uniref:Uncharacterized protein n=1 Tax=uncultured marine group II/III euryarchaeote KM3_87_B04 TaxID=1456530 RepID=A0A075HUZ4_9EURY|nr:hypothetical protein [uncultured marine group II/III euryarchaeote KM3_87_B04]
MVRIISQNEVYLDYFISYEKRFESIILDNKQALFQGGHYCRWDPLLKDRQTNEGVQPDGFLVAHDFQSWWVVEIENSEYKMNEIQEQLTKIARVDYSKEEISIKLALNKMDLEPNRASEIAKIKPNFLCIIDTQNDSVSKICAYSGFELMIAKPIQSQSLITGLVIEKDGPLSESPNSEISLEIDLTVHEERNLIGGKWHFKLPPAHILTKWLEGRDEIRIEQSDSIIDCDINRYDNETFLVIPIGNNHSSSISRLVRGMSIGHLLVDEKAGLLRLRVYRRW